MPTASPGAPSTPDVADPREDPLEDPLRQAQLCLQGGDWLQARRCFAAALDADPANGAAIAGMAAVARRLGDHAAAARWYRGAIELQPDHPGLYVELAAELREMGRLDEAERMCRAVLNADPENWLAFVGLGLVGRRRGDHEMALKYMHCAYLLQSAHEGVQGELASTLLQLGRLDEAELVWRRALQARPQAPGALAALAHICALRGKPEEAQAQLLAAIALDPANAELQLRLAALERERGRMEEAAAIVARLLQSQPEHAGALFEQALLARARNDRPAALAALRRAAQLGQRRAWIEAASEHLALGQPAQAQAAYRHVLDEAPGDFDARYGLAELHLSAAEYAACVEDCDALIASFPAHPAPCRLKCQALLQLDRSDEALRVSAALVARAAAAAPIATARQRPDEARAFALRLEVLRATGQRQEALALLADPRRAQPRSFSLWTESVQARLAFGDYAGAQAAFADAPAGNTFERSRVSYLEGVLADLQWRVPEAMGAFERVLELLPTDTGAHEFLARFQFLRADAAHATHHLQRYLAQSATAILLRGGSSNPSQTHLGMLLNELKLDAPLLARLHALSALAPPERVPALIDAVRAHPGLTPPAMYLLLALRQAGELVPRAAPGRPALLGRLLKALHVPAKASARPIPRSIVQYWDDGAPPDPVARAMDSWTQAHPGYAYRRFDRAAARDDIARHHPRAVLSAFLRASDPAQAADIFRLAYLSRKGGWFVGAELRCVGSLAPLGIDGTHLVCPQEIHANLGTSLLGCTPREAVVVRALAQAVDALTRGEYSDNLWLSTGPGLLTRAFAQELAQSGDGWRAALAGRRILDRGELSRVAWTYPMPPNKKPPARQRRAPR